MRYLPKEMAGLDATELLDHLRYVWSRQEILDISRISDHPEGHVNDGLPDFRDEIGRIELKGAEVPIYMQRVPDGKGGRVWKISNATVAEIPIMWAELGYSPVAEYLRENLPEFGFLGMENWHSVRQPLRIITESDLCANIPLSSVARIFFFIFMLILSLNSSFLTM